MGVLGDHTRNHHTFKDNRFKTRITNDPKTHMMFSRYSKCSLILIVLGINVLKGDPNMTGNSSHRSTRTAVLESMVETKTPLYGYLCTDIEMIQEYSLHDVESCDLDPIKHEITDEGNYQIAQLAKYHHVTVKRCQVTYTISAFVCSWDYGAFAVHGSMKQMEEIAPLECEIMHSRQTYKAGDGENYDTPVNKTTTFQTNLVGYISSDGDCMGSGGTDAKGVYHDYLVKLADYEIKLVERVGLVNTKTNTITFNQGGEQFTCLTANKYCINIYGTFVWDLTSITNCPVEPIREFTGVIHHAKDMPMVLIGDEKSLIFLELRDQEHVCHRKVYTTNVDRIMVLKLEPGVMPFIKTKIIPENVDLFLNMDIKLSWAYNTALIKSESLYSKIVKYICEEQRARLLDKLRLLSTLAELTDITVSNQRGTQITVVGEVVYESKCKQVQVTLRPLDYCTNELPISITTSIENKEEHAFLTPVSRIITYNASEITCSAIFPPKFKYGPHTWITYGPHVAETKAPQIVPLKDYKMHKYKPVTSFTSGGIYSPEDIKRAKELLLYPTLLRASQNTLVRRINLKSTHNNIDLSSLITPNEFKTAFENFFKKTFGILALIGQYAAGLYTIYLIYHFLTAAIKTMISAKSIYKLYGKSTKLLYALCSCTRLIFLHEELKPSDRNKSIENITKDDGGTRSRPKWRFPEAQRNQPSCPKRSDLSENEEAFEWPDPPQDMHKEAFYDVPRKSRTRSDSYFSRVYPILKRVRFEDTTDETELESLNNAQPSNTEHKTHSRKS